MAKRKNNDECDSDKENSAEKPFREKLDLLVGKIISEGETSESLKKNPRAALKKLGFSENEIETIGDISFDIFLKQRDSNMLKPTPLPCSPNDPTKTIIVFKSGETVTGGKFFIDLDNLTAED